MTLQAVSVSVLHYSHIAFVSRYSFFIVIKLTTVSAAILLQDRSVSYEAYFYISLLPLAEFIFDTVFKYVHQIVFCVLPHRQAVLLTCITKRMIWSFDTNLINCFHRIINGTMETVRFVLTLTYPWNITEFLLAGSREVTCSRFDRRRER